MAVIARASYTQVVFLYTEKATLPHVTFAMSIADHFLVITRSSWSYVLYVTFFDKQLDTIEQTVDNWQE